MARFEPTDWQARTHFGTPEVARRVEVAGAGVRLPAAKLNPARLRAAVRTAIARRPGAERIESAFASAGGPTAAADALEQLAGSHRHQGARSQDPARPRTDLVQGGPS
ncbi:MAG: hypothetical protein AB7J47_02600 [Acidimicrobiia bacterium]